MRAEFYGCRTGEYDVSKISSSNGLVACVPGVNRGRGARMREKNEGYGKGTREQLL